ncbi:MAG: tetratricopeptide repeat protein [Thermoplasmata archaeon]
MYNNLAIVEMNRNINDALKIYQTTLNYADISGNINIVALVHSNLSQIYFWSGNVKDAEKEITISEKLSELEEEYNIRYDISAFRADLKASKGDFRDAIVYLDRAIKISEERGSEFYKNLYELKKLEFKTLLGQKIDENTVKKFVSTISEKGNEISIYYILPYVGLIYLYSGNFEQALNVLEKCYKEGSGKLTFLELVIAMGNLPFVHLMLKNKDGFIEYYNILKEKSKMLNIDIFYLHVYNTVYNYIMKKEENMNEEENYFIERGLWLMLLNMYISYYKINPKHDVMNKINETAKKMGIEFENLSLLLKK